MHPCVSAQLFPSHVLRAVGCFCVSVEVCLQHHPHLHSTMTESIYSALFDRSSPALLVKVMQDYRDHASYAYQFIKRLGGSPRIPSVCWERWEAAAAADGDGGGDVNDSMLDESLDVSMMSIGDEDHAGADRAYGLSERPYAASAGDQLSRPLVNRSGEWDLSVSVSAASDEGLAGLRFQFGGGDSDGNDGDNDVDDDGEPASLVPINSGYSGVDEDEDSDGAQLPITLILIDKNSSSLSNKFFNP